MRACLDRLDCCADIRKTCHDDDRNVCSPCLQFLKNIHPGHVGEAIVYQSKLERLRFEGADAVLSLVRGRNLVALPRQKTFQYTRKCQIVFNQQNRSHMGLKIKRKAEIPSSFSISS